MIAHRRVLRIALAVVAAAAVILMHPAHMGSQTRPGIPSFHPPATSIEKRVSDLLKTMTLEEKVAQLRCTIRRVAWGENINEDGLGGRDPSSGHRPPLPRQQRQMRSRSLRGPEHGSASPC